MKINITSKNISGLIETLYLMSIPGMKESILEGSKEPLENFSEEIDWDDLDEDEEK